jgi:hypothetical protein
MRHEGTGRIVLNTTAQEAIYQDAIPHTGNTRVTWPTCGAGLRGRQGLHKFQDEAAGSGVAG